MQTDIQELIPDAHRDVVEAVPKGVVRSLAFGGILLGGLMGALLCMLVEGWLVPAVFGSLLAVQRIWVWRSDQSFDRRVAELNRRGLIWQTGHDRSHREGEQAGSSSGGQRPS